MERSTAGFQSITDESIPRFIGISVVFLVPLLLAVVILQISSLIPIEGAFSWLMLGTGLLAVVGVLAINNERTWIFTAIAAHALMLAGGKEQAIGVGEVGYGVVVLGGMAFWFVKEWTLRRRIIETGFDLLLASFVVLSTVVTLLSTLLHEGDMFAYLKEWGILADILFYFPLRRTLRTRQDIYLLFSMFAVVALANGVMAMSTYRQRLAEAVYQWQLKARSNINEPTSMALLILSAGVVALAQRWRMRLLGFAGVVLGTILLLITYSRNPILSGFLGVLIMSVLIPWRNSRRVVTALLLSVTVGTAIAFVVYPKIATIITSALESRIASVVQAGSDLSLKARIVESETLINRYIVRSPLIGYGYGVPFGFTTPITGTWGTTIFVHNGYLWSIYKFGIPIALLLMATILYPVGRLLVRAPKRHSGFNRVLMAGITGYCLCVLMMNMTSTLFTGVSAMMNFAICWSLFDYLHRNQLPAQQLGVSLAGAPEELGQTKVST